MPAIEASCPACGAINAIEMKKHEPQHGSFSNFLYEIVGDMGLSHYIFAGEGKCSKCGKGINISLNVSSDAKGVQK